RVVRNEDLGARRGGVGDLVVDVPVVIGAVRVAVADGEAHLRLLFAGGEEVGCAAVTVARAAVQPDAVVQVHDVDGRHLAVGVLDVRTDGDDVPVDRRLGDVTGAEVDVVLPGRDRDGPVLELQGLDAGHVLRPDRVGLCLV